MILVEDIKIEPISPLPSTPHGGYSPVLENKTELQVRVEMSCFNVLQLKFNFI